MHIFSILLLVASVFSGLVHASDSTRNIGLLPPIQQFRNANDDNKIGLYGFENAKGEFKYLGHIDARVLKPVLAYRPYNIGDNSLPGDPNYKLQPNDRSYFEFFVPPTEKVTVPSLSDRIAATKQLRARNTAQRCCGCTIL